MKTALINFELWHSYDDVYNEEKINSLRISLILNDIKKAIKRDNIDSILGLLLIDGFLYSEKFYETLNTVQIEAKKLGIKNFYLLPGMCGLEKYQEEINKRNLSYTVITGYDFSAKQMYLSYKHLEERVWNDNTDKFLFLGGVPNRPNRIGLLSKYYDNGMLENAIWSFFPPWTEESKIWCRNYLSRYTDAEYERFIKFCSRSIDYKYQESKEYSTSTGLEIVDKNILNTSWVRDPSHIDPHVYENTSLSIISKYEYDNATSHSFLGEKTWRAIINKHPFIMIDNKPSERFDYMKTLGINMFDKFSIPDYGYIENEEERIDIVVNATKIFLNNISKYKKQIYEDIEHNYNIFLQVNSANFKIENYIKTELGASDVDMKWFESKGYDKFIRVSK